MLYSLLNFDFDIAKEEIERGLELYKSGKVSLKSKSSERLVFSICDDEVSLDKKLGLINKQAGDASVIAALKFLEKLPYCDEFLNSMLEFRAKSFMGLELKDKLEKRKLKLKVELGLLENGIKFDFYIGFTKFYKLKSLRSLISSFEEGMNISLSKKMIFSKADSFFDDVDMNILISFKRALSLELASEIKSSVIVGRAFLGEALTSLENKSFSVVDGEKTLVQNGILERRLPFSFTLSGDDRQMVLSARGTGGKTLLDDGASFYMDDSGIFKLSREDRQLAGFFMRRGFENLPSLVFSSESFKDLLGRIIPYVERRARIDIDDRLERIIVREKLETKIFLDKHLRGLRLELRFCYGENELSPFTSSEDKLIIRDSEKEGEILKLLLEMGFFYEKPYLYIQNDDEVYEFLSEGIERLKGRAELYLSNDFKRISIKKSSLSGHVNIKNSSLVMELFNEGERIDDVQALIKAISEGKRYYRLENDSFLELESDEGLKEISRLLRQRQADRLPLYLASELNLISRENGLKIDFSPEALRCCALRAGELKTPIDEMHSYQKRGMQWLYSLYYFGMGGILADEMGLGKTLQVLACMLEQRRIAKENNEKIKHSIVVVPSSLVFNWEKEVKRFAESLDVLILHDKKEERLKMLSSLSESEPRLIIVSYSTLRQDIDEISKISFDFAVLDEAQMIKNPYGQTARSVKMLESRTKICLTGTPLENNIADLWSLFDFCLPGFLPPLYDFIKENNEPDGIERLSKRISPFIMRRLKKEVITELPDKLEYSYLAHMTKEQEMIYRAHKLRLKDRLESAALREGLSSIRGDILSWLTELREICCSPRLVNRNYRFSSAKELLLLDILPSIVDNKHRVLIFSQFTRMLKILERSIEGKGIKCFYLDGKTALEDRLSLVERFNAGERDVFLISLKAGGTGLNLTGADTVINFDPWWNPQSENQAIDRAHRLGQTKSVHVIRLVTKDTIEEKVMQLSQNKREIFDSLLGGEKVTKHSLEEMISLLKD